MQQSIRNRPDDSSARLTKRFIIGFAIVEALLIGYMILSGHIS